MSWSLSTVCDALRAGNRVFELVELVELQDELLTYQEMVDEGSLGLPAADERRLADDLHMVASELHLARC